ncbi:MAG: PilC/PilY family type IV pilus protein, partial [Pseudomonadota bacterium]
MISITNMGIITKAYKNKIAKALWVSSVFISVLLISSLVMADDTEIFFGGAVGGDAEVQPNILMILDTSGSMSATDGTNPAVSRIDRVKASMYDILTTVDNVNMGLMRFNNPGGPILYPLVDIDGDACEVENCADVEPIVSSRIRNDNEDAEELSDGTVNLFNDNLNIVDNPGSGAETTTVSFFITDYTDDIEERISDGVVEPSGGQDFEMMDDSWSYSKSKEQLIGTRFRNIAIPADATIISAKIVLTIKDEEMVDSRENDSVFIDVRGEKSADTSTFQTTNYNLSSRPKTTAKVNWDIVANSPSSGNTIETPDLIPIVNEIIAEGWVTGNAMTFYFQSDPYATNTNIEGDPSFDGNGMRRVYTRNSSSSRQPRLEVTYVVGNALADSTQIIGLHFNDVSVPQGVTITDAFLDFTVQTVTSGTAGFNIVAEKSINSATFDSSNFSLSSRIDTPAEKTIASVAWVKSDPAVGSDNLDNWNEAGVIEQSPDIKTIIQELVNQSDWCGGNAISLFITGSGQRIAVSHDLSAGDAPNLRISYDTGTIPSGAGNEGCMNTIINKPVTASSDDAEEEGDGSVTRTSYDLDFRSYNNDRTKHSGLRFVDMKIPKDAEILEARLELHLRDNDEPGTVTMTVKAQNAGDSDKFIVSNSNISNRPTVGSVSWVIPDAADGETLVSPDISSLIQSVVNRGDWAANNAITLILSYTSGVGHKEITTYNADPINAPRLIIKTRWEGNDGGPLITNRSKMVQVVDDLSASGYTPIVSVLDEARRYFEGLPVLHGSYRGLDPAYTNGSSTQNANSSYGTKYRVSHPASYTPGALNREAGCTDSSISSTACKSENISAGIYKSPMHENYPTDDAKSCQRNFIILLTDGQANAKNNTTTTDIAALSGDTYSVGSCSTSNPSDSYGKKCGPELTKYMYENDLDSTIANKQNVTTYTIGFAFSSDWIKKVATDGGGSFFEASGDTSQLTGIFESILREIISVDTTFVSPGATVNQFNRLFHRNEVYFSLFKPGEHAQWDGNLKKYLLEIVDPFDPNNPDHPTNGVAQIVGQHSTHTDDPTTDNAQSAVNTSTGFFEEDAQSYWSTVVDGSEVSKGGAAEQIPNSRPNGGATDTSLHLYTDIGGSNDIDMIKIHEDNSATITKALLDITLESDANHTKLLRWIRGVDVDSATEDLRDWMGDPLHSHPGLVTYGGTDELPILRLFVGSNDGFFHILDASSDTTATEPRGMGTGREIFAFMPQELLKNQNTYYQNTLGQHPYGVDGAISFWVNDDNSDNTISDSDHVYAYFGLRRGGKSYYALDVTGCNGNSCAPEPSIKWKITNADGSGTLSSTTGVQINQFKELGQSWSKMEFIKIKINSVVKNVLIFGGGYDPSNDTSSTRTADTQGRAIYIIDADTGERLWVAGSASSADFASGLSFESADMQYSIPADIRVIDTTGDGLANQFYVGDMGGQIWRFDVNNSASSWGAAITGGVIADLAENASTDNNRRFFYAVDIALTNIDKIDVLTLVIGSGWRSHPLDSVVDDRLFVLKTTDVYSAPKDESTG